jgi:nicotinate dehydrogenase subunit B
MTVSGSPAPPFGSGPPLALNSNLHSAAPGNLNRSARQRIAGVGYMHGFKDSLSTDQVTELVYYLRQQHAPDKPAWSGVDAAVGRAMQATSY